MARCKSCDHDTQIHASDGSGCLFTVAKGRVGQDLVCPCTVDAYRPERCKATEGATGISCHLQAGHLGDHAGQHTPRTDGTDSVGYPLSVRWPYTDYDRDAGIRPQSIPTREADRG